MNSLMNITSFNENLVFNCDSHQRESNSSQRIWKLCDVIGEHNAVAGLDLWTVKPFCEILKRKKLIK
jgi:hypothetical protein